MFSSMAGKGIYPSPLETSDIMLSNPLMFFIQPFMHALVIYNHACTNQYSAKDLRDSLCRSRKCSLYRTLSPVLSPENSRYLGLPWILTLSPQLRSLSGSASSLHFGLGSLSQHLSGTSQDSPHFLTQVIIETLHFNVNWCFYSPQHWCAWKNSTINLLHPNICHYHSVF